MRHLRYHAPLGGIYSIAGYALRCFLRMNVRSFTCPNLLGAQKKIFEKIIIVRSSFFFFGKCGFRIWPVAVRTVRQRAR